MSYNSGMVRICVRELNQHTSRVLDRVKRGMVVEITERGRPVARVVPVGQAAPQSLLERLVAEGRAKPPTITGPLPTPQVTGDPTVSVADVIAAMRDEERW
jgi:prevent-host-death family protein